MVNKILFEDIYPFVRDAKRYAIKEKTVSPVANYDNLLVYLLKGKAQFKIEDSIYNMEHGDALIIRAGTFYEYTPLDDEFSCIFIDFDYTLLQKDIKLPKLSDDKSDFKRSKKIAETVLSDVHIFNTTIYVKKIQLLEEKMIEIVEEFVRKNDYSDMKCSAGMMAILSDVARRLRLGTPETSDNKGLVEEVLEYINEHYDERLTNNSIGALFAIHPNHVNTLVKKKTGYTLHHYLVVRRIAKALEMIDKTDLPMCEISDRCGFTESKNFIRLFKNTVGITPHQYRKRK